MKIPFTNKTLDILKQLYEFHKKILKSGGILSPLFYLTAPISFYITIFAPIESAIEQNVEIWLIALVYIFVFSLLAMSVSFIHELNRTRNFVQKSITLLGLFSAAGCTIATYAFLHHYINNGELDGLTDSESIYFSIVTFTTLGYGEITPDLKVNILAVTEAIFGPIYLSLAVWAASIPTEE